MSKRDELVAAIVERNARCGRKERGRILDEFTAVTNFHRKHGPDCCGLGSQDSRLARVWGDGSMNDAVRAALIVIWKGRNGCVASG